MSTTLTSNTMSTSPFTLIERANPRRPCADEDFELCVLCVIAVSRLLRFSVVVKFGGVLYSPGLRRRLRWFADETVFMR